MARVRLLLLFVGVMLLAGVPAVRSDDSALPYIYYYANTVNAIVVERANGADSRLIAPGAMPPDHMVIDDLDWSPSGEWLAWRSATATENFPGAYSGWIARSDGSQRLTLLDDMGGDVLNIQWSPTSDLLFIAHAIERLQLQLMIIDPAANKIIAQTLYESKNWILEDYDQASGWLANGEEVYFGAEVYPSYLLANLTVNNLAHTALFRGQYNFNGEIYESQVINLQEGRLFYFDDSDAFIEDLLTGKRVQIAANSNRQTYNKVYWNPGMTYALIVSRDCSTRPCSSEQLYLLDWEANTVHRLDPRMSALDDDYGEPMWSADGRYLLMADTVAHKLAVMDMFTRELSLIIPPQGSLYYEWSDANILYLLTDIDTITYRYDIATKRMRSLPMLPQNTYYSLSPAPDGIQVGLYNYRSHTGMIVNLDTRQRLTWPPHSLGTNGTISAEYLWHPDSQWFFSSEHISFAGGGGGPEALMILDMEGTIRRELSLCYCYAGFVPERALPHLGEGSPTSVIPEPTYTLPHENRVTGVTWSPDGKKVASYSFSRDYDTGGKLHIWDVSGTPELLTTYNVEMACDQRSFFCHLDWSADSRTIRLNNDSILEVWDIEADKHTVTDFSQSPLCNAYQVISPDGLLVACVGNIDDNTGISIVDTRTGLTVGTIAHQWGVLGWSSGSKTLFLENGLALWDAEEIQTLEAPMGIYSADTRPTSRYIVEASLYHRIYIWDAETGQRLPDLNWYATAVALSPDGTRLAAAGTHLVTLWDTAAFDR